MKNWSPQRRLRFLFAYAWAKIRLLYDVRNPKLRFFFFEIHYSITNLVNSVRLGLLKQTMYQGPETILTRYETFKVRRGTQDAAVISPAFERSDLEYLFRLAREIGATGPVDFVDIGANIGQFCVRLPKRLKNIDLRIWAFEPVPQNVALLKANLEGNSIREARVYDVALSDHKGQMYMRFNFRQSGDSTLLSQAGCDSIQVRVSRGDDLLTDLRPSSARLIKIDVEGHEMQVLKGLENTLSQGRSTDLCIEDVNNKAELYRRLEDLGFEFKTKLTPYNSWWRRKSRVTH